MKMNLECKVYNKGYVLFTIIFASIILFAMSICFLLFSLTYDNLEYLAKIFMYIISGLCFIGGLLFSVVCPILLCKYPKYKRLTRMFIKETEFLSDEEIKDRLAERGIR